MPDDEEQAHAPEVEEWKQVYKPPDQCYLLRKEIDSLRSQNQQLRIEIQRLEKLIVKS